MTKKYILRTIAVGVILFAAGNHLFAQERASSSLKVDSGASYPQTEPGRLFNLARKYSTAAVSSVSGNALYNTPTPNLSNTLMGKLPGLTVRMGGGEPGVDNASTAIRGAGTYSTMLNGELFRSAVPYKIFVDGFETNQEYYQYLSPSEIENVSILKDAASLATFGMRGANGILWVTTKRGAIGKSSVKVQVRSGVQNALNINKPLDSYGFANLYNQAVSNDNGGIWTPAYSTAQLDAYKNGTATNISWFDQVLKENGMYTNADVVFTGGSPQTRYNVVFDYGKQGGLYDVAKTSRTSPKAFSNYNLRTNLDLSISKGVEASIGLNGRLEDRRGPNIATYDLWNNLASYPSNIYTPKVDDTRYSGTAIYNNNPLAAVQALGFATSQNRILQANFGLKEELNFIAPGLYAQEAYSFNVFSVSTYNKTADYARYSGTTIVGTNQTTPITASSLGASRQYDWRQGSATIGYDKQFGANSLKSAINYHISDYRGDGASSFAYHYQNISGRANYTFNDRYVGEFGFSYFGTDAYAKDSRWGFYPAVSAAWIVSNESFLKNSAKINYLKLRGSVGKTGWSDTNEGLNNGRFLYQQYYTTAAANGGAFWRNNGTPAQQGVLNTSYIANPNLTAEESLKYDIGLDLNIINKIALTADVFLDKRSGIVTRDQSIPASFGYVDYYSNIGKVTNKGFEGTATFSDKIGRVNYTLSGSAFFNKNKLNYSAEIPPPNSYNSQTGRPLGTRIGLVSNGFYQIEDFNVDGTLKSGIAVPAFGTVRAGDIRYKDLDGNSRIDEGDYTSVGKSNLPELTYTFGGSLEFKNFDLSAFLQGTKGSAVNLIEVNAVNQTNNLLQVQAFVNNGNAFPIAQGAWAYYPAQGIDTRATATYPRLSRLANDNNFRTSDFWMKSADFLRIRNIELGYTFSSSLSKKLGMSTARFFINAINPVTWSSLLKNYNMDPESTSGYSGLKSYNTGIVVNF